MTVRGALDRLLRVGAKGMFAILKLSWFVRRPRTFGAHAFALTAENRLILVKLRYADGWRLPGGGRKPDEDPCDAALRELGEEIGMTAHGQSMLACELEEEVHCKRDFASLVVVRDVVYRPRWSLEVERIEDFALASLPDDLSPRNRRWIERLLPLL